MFLQNMVACQKSHHIETSVLHFYITRIASDTPVYIKTYRKDIKKTRSQMSCKQCFLLMNPTCLIVLLFKSDVLPHEITVDIIPLIRLYVVFSLLSNLLR